MLRHFRTVILAIVTLTTFIFGQNIHAKDLHTQSRDIAIKMALTCIANTKPEGARVSHLSCNGWYNSLSSFQAITRALLIWPDHPLNQSIIRALNDNLTVKAVLSESKKLLQQNNTISPELIYGLSRVLALSSELRRLPYKQSAQWRQTMIPIEVQAAKTMMLWLNQLKPSTNFNNLFAQHAMATMLDWSHSRNDNRLTAAISHRIRELYKNYHDCQFDIPTCLNLAALMTKVLTADDFLIWFSLYIPSLPLGSDSSSLTKQLYTEEFITDKFIATEFNTPLVLSQPWVMRDVATALSVSDPRYNMLINTADHLQSLILESLIIESLTLKSLISSSENKHPWIGSYIIRILTDNTASQQ